MWRPTSTVQAQIALACVALCGLTRSTAAHSLEGNVAEVHRTIAGLRFASFRESSPSPFEPRPIVDPTGDASDLCRDYECSGNETACDQFPERVCMSYGPCHHKACLHKQLVPMLGQDLQLFLALFLVATLAGATGIGGGGINVPFLMMLNSFAIKEAVPISHVAVLGNALVQLFINMWLRHPEVPQRPLIHHELAWLLLPTMLGGNSLGIIVGRLFPPTLLVVLSLVLLAATSTKTFVKGVAVMRDQAARKARSSNTRSTSTQVQPTAVTEGTAARGTGANITESSPQINRVDGISAVSPGTVASSGDLLSDASHRREAELDSMPARIPWRVIIAMIGFNVFFCLDYLWMSKDVFGVKACSPMYWIAFLGIYPVIIGAIWLAIRMLRDLQKWHVQVDGGPIAGDPQIDGRKAVMFALAAVVIGLVSGLLGLGGGEFMVPLLLEFGALPRVAAATSGFIMVFTTSSNVVHYIIAGTLEPFFYYSVVCFLIAGVGAWAGLRARDRYVKQNSWVLVFLVAIILLFSGFLLALRGLILPSRLDWQFRTFCS